MSTALPRLRYREATVLAVVTVLVLALGWVIARDVRQWPETASRLYARLAQGLDLIDKLQFTTQEVRRILLYALHTSDANVQLGYAEQSRAADVEVQRLLDASANTAPAATRADVDRVARVWRDYLTVRDEVIGLILEGSLQEGVALDQDQGLVRYNAVREAIEALKARVEADAAIQVAGARAQASRATAQLLILVISALVGAAIGISLVNRRAALEALLRSEAHKGSILQAVPDPIVSADEQARIVELNAAAERTFGVPRREALGRSLASVIMPPHAYGTLARVLADTPALAITASARIQSVGRRADGTEFPMEFTAVSHVAGRDRIWTLHLADITGRRQVETDLRRAKEAAESADRAKSDFLATISHELRTPLNGVIGTADLLQAATLTARDRELVRMLRSSATALLGLVSDILDYSRIEAGLMEVKPVVSEVAACIEDAFDSVSELAARKGLDLGYLVEPGVPPVIVADRDRVVQVLLNLLSNAVKFTDAGEVAVHVSAARQEEGRIEMCIRVRDTGIGIPAHLQERLFTRFSQLDAGTTRHYGGAGLGLAISERLSTLLGGSLRVHSVAGEGATFTFRFIASEAPRAPLASPRPFEGLRVLAHVPTGIVGDQLRCMLENWGADVTIAGPGMEGLRPDCGAYDVLVIDRDFANEAFQQLAAADADADLRRVPIVALRRVRGTGYATHPGAADIAKPLRGRALEDALREVIDVPDAPAKPAAPSASLAALPLTILLVEDNRANRRVLQLMLEEMGLRADEAESGTEAVVRAQARDYDVILMDLQMPGLDGLEATRRIRRLDARTRPVIIALTANAMRGEEARCREAGMDAYLAKPLRLDTLTGVLTGLAAMGHPRSA
jgi:PAS domain S-box-containing protein